MTAGELIDNVLFRLEDAAVFWSRVELLVLVNDGILEFTLISGYLMSDTTYTLIGSKLQAVPSTAIGIVHIAYADKKVEKTTIEDLDRQDRRWDYKSGILKHWMPCGLDRFIVDRHPQEAVDVVLTTLDQPTVLAEEDEIVLDPEYVKAIEDYVFHGARFKEGGQEFADAQDAYDDFAAKAGLRSDRTFAQMMTVWSREPAADTGMGYGTLHKA